MEETKRIVESFEANADDVRRLIHFDREILGVAVAQLENLHDRLVKGGFTNPALNAKNTLAMMKSVRDNDSLKARYAVIYNQGIVLLVSYFGSAIEDLFKHGVSVRIERDDPDSKLMREDLRLSLGEMKERDWNLKDAAPDLLVEKKDLSFQDMQAIRRAFDEYLIVPLEKDRVVNNIILAQACRHVIVHSGGIASYKLVRQVSGAKPRDLRPDIPEGEPIEFTPEEVEVVASSMATYVRRAAGLLESALTPPGS